MFISENIHHSDHTPQELIRTNEHYLRLIKGLHVMKTCNGAIIM